MSVIYSREQMNEPTTNRGNLASPPFRVHQAVFVMHKEAGVSDARIPFPTVCIRLQIQSGGCICSDVFVSKSETCRENPDTQIHRYRPLKPTRPRRQRGVAVLFVAASNQIVRFADRSRVRAS